VLLPVRLENFTSRDPGTGKALADAQDKLQKASAELEAVLQQIAEPSSKKMLNLKKELEDRRAWPNPVPLDAVVKSLQYDQEIRADTTSAKVRRFMAVLYPIAKLALNLAGGAATTAGFVPVQIAANGLSQVLDLAMRPSKATEKVEAGLETLTRDQRFLRELRELPPSTHEESLLICAVELQAALVGFLRTSLLWLRKNDFVRFANCTMESKDVDEATNSLKTARDALMAATSQETYLLVKWREVRTQEAELLRKVCTDHFHDAQIDMHARLHRDRFPHTARWILHDDRYLRFRKGNVQALWCPGKRELPLASIGTVC